MSDELQAQVAEFLKALMSTANSASTWAQTQVPELLQEKILLGRVNYTLYALIFGAIAWKAAVSARGHFIRISADKDSWSYGPPPGIVPAILCTILTVAAAFVALLDLEIAISAWVAPRVYVLEWIMGLAK